LSQGIAVSVVGVVGIDWFRPRRRIPGWINLFTAGGDPTFTCCTPDCRRSWAMRCTTEINGHSDAPGAQRACQSSLEVHRSRRLEHSGPRPKTSWPTSGCITASSTCRSSTV